MKIANFLARVLVVVLIVTFTIITLRAVISKTPKGIIIDPVYSFKLAGAFTNIEELARKFGEEVRYDKWDRDKTPHIITSLPKERADTNEERNVFRTVEIYQFGTKQGARNTYLKHKRIFAEGRDNKLYREDGTDDDKYFLAYKPIRFDYNHGIPCGLITSPDITVVFLKNNLFILISYSGYFRNYDNYTNEMNDDIAYVGELLKAQKAK